jgi:hypothetical protein
MNPETTVTPSVVVTESFIDLLVSSGGFTHPLFNPTPEQRVGGQVVPLPGQGLLVLAGGLAEQSGVLDKALALLEMKSVRFLKMTSAGSILHLILVPGAEKPTASGKVVREYAWTMRDSHGDTVMEATTIMLMSE